MQYCFCGDLADGAGTRCARCAALDELELKADASESEIKEAYRVLVKVWHPDRFQSDKKLRTAAEDKLKAVNSAYVFLTSRAAKRDHRKRTAQTPKPDAYKPDTYKADASGAYTSEPRVVARRRGLMPSPAALVGFGALACGVLIAALAFKSIDSSLASDPVTGRIYSELRASVANSFRQAAGTIWSGAGQQVRDLLPQRSTAAAAASLQPADAAQPASQPDNIGPSVAQGAITQSAHKRELGAAHAAPIKLLPYVTVGLTRDEVIAIDGAPAAAADGKLVYQGAELNFTDGKVSGWKIDPASASIRVKLWPNAPVDPDLDSFGVGSSKNVVLVVEGTPTYFSGSKFGYGGSEVYFQNDRVVSWKEDPAWPLHIAPR
jgi:curved DNA-binding protein CbpA